jgi:small-conductance mechanosensitive channel
MTPPAPAGDFASLLDGLARPSALIELAVLAGCVGLAWLIVRALRGPASAAPVPVHGGSIWFGRRIVDGVLFPLVVLALALVARLVLREFVPITLFRVAMPILASLAVIRLTGRVLRRTFPDSRTMRVFERSVSWFAWGAVVLWVTGVLPIVLEELDAITWKLGGTQVSVRNLLEGAIAAVVVMMLVLWLSSLLEARLLAGGGNLSIRKMAANLLRALLIFLGLIFALSAAGIDLTALGVLGGAVGVGIGLGLQRLASNYVSGFVILAEQSVRIGDVVKVDNFEGRITDINTRYTVVRALNGRESVVPNEMFVTQRVENSSLADPKVLLSTIVQVAYGTDLDALRPALLDAVRGVPRVLADPGPAVQLSAFAPDGLELTVLFWIDDPHNGQGNVRSDVNLAILGCLNAQGIDIPFPQRVLRRAAG